MGSVLHREDLPRTGFAGVREHRLVMDPRVFGDRAAQFAWPGIGQLVYLADARFVPNGSTGMHPHHEVDVISVMVEGRIEHRGSLEDGSVLHAPSVQVQRAGGDGFRHDEVNPDDVENRMLQLWVVPERPGQPAGYHSYDLERGTGPKRVYGGPPGQDETFPARTTIDVGLLAEGEEFSVDGAALVYLAEGKGRGGGGVVEEGDLVRTVDYRFRAAVPSLVVAIGEGW